MLTDIRHKLGLSLAIVLLSAMGARAQVGTPIDVAVGYSYVHANAGPGVCGCFSMNGLNGGFGATLGHGVSLIADMGFYGQGNVDNSGRGLHLETLLFGPRYSSSHWKRWTPYGQFLLGGALTQGALYGPNSTTSGSASGFAWAGGGGLEFNATQHVSIRLIQAEYLMTRLPNNANNYQNNIRISAGVVFHLNQPHNR